TDVITYAREKPGMSTFVLEDGVVYHAYSAYARGLDGLWGAYQWLDRAPKGRNENGYWWRRHDQYGQSSSAARVLLRQPAVATPLKWVRRLSKPAAPSRCRDFSIWTRGGLRKHS